MPAISNSGFSTEFVPLIVPNELIERQLGFRCATLVDLFVRSTVASIYSSYSGPTVDSAKDLVQSLVGKSRQHSENVGALHYSLPDGWRNLLGHQEQFVFISIEDIRQPVDQCLAGIVPISHGPRLDSAQISEPDAD